MNRIWLETGSQFQQCVRYFLIWAILFRGILWLAEGGYNLSESLDLQTQSWARPQFGWKNANLCLSHFPPQQPFLTSACWTSCLHQFNIILYHNMQSTLQNEGYMGCFLLLKRDHHLFRCTAFFEGSALCMFYPGLCFNCNFLSRHSLLSYLMFILPAVILHLTDWHDKTCRDASDSNITTLIERLTASISGFVHFLRVLDLVCWLLLIIPCLYDIRCLTHTEIHIHMRARTTSYTDTPTFAPLLKTHWVNFSPPSVRTHTAANAEIKARHWRIY